MYIEPATFFRRILAMVYDTFLLAGVLFAASAIAVTFNHGEAIEHPLFRVYLLFVSGLFYTWFWKQKGQTLGMQVWNLHIQNLDGSQITWLQAWIRFFGSIVSLALLGIGYLWIIIDPARRAFHDKWARSSVVFIPPQ